METDIIILVSLTISAVAPGLLEAAEAALEVSAVLVAEALEAVVPVVVGNNNYFDIIRIPFI